MRGLRLHITAGPVHVRYRAVVALAPSDRQMAPTPLPDLGSLDLRLHEWTLPSRYCPSDLLATRAEAMFADHPRDPSLIEAVRAWVQRSIAYTPGASDVHTAADETLQRRAGVCRDLAHLAITLLRALDVPARMVAAYALDLEPPDFHALVEAHDGVRWRLLDPTGLASVDTVVRIATGRDAAEVAWASTSGDLALEHLEVAATRR